MNDSAEHQYMLIQQNSIQDVVQDLIKQHINVIQSDVKQLSNRVERTEQQITTLAQQQKEMADSDMVIIRS